MQKCKNAKDILYSADIAHDITFAFLHFLCKTCKKGQNEGILGMATMAFLRRKCDECVVSNTNNE